MSKIYFLFDSVTGQFFRSGNVHSNGFQIGDFDKAFCANSKRSVKYRLECVVDIITQYAKQFNEYASLHHVDINQNWAKPYKLAKELYEQRKHLDNLGIQVFEIELTPNMGKVVTV